MEVDMQSPPSAFRPIPFTIKRPRSPGSPGSPTQERQVKRPSLAAPVGLEVLAGRRPYTASPADGVGGRMASQDDWVQQARELSIASPLSVTAGFTPALVDGGATVAQSRLDEHMAVDDDIPVLRVHVHPGSARSWTATRSHLPPIQITTATAISPGLTASGLHAPSPALFSVLTEPPSSSSDSASSPSSPSVTRTGGATARATHLRPPDIFLFPATPSDGVHECAAGEGVRMEGSGMLQSRTATPDRADGRAGSPRPTRTGDMPTSSGRKHRVTMGPRADCVKCRTGVRGHWMHFD